MSDKGEGKKIVLDPTLFEKEAEEASRLLNQSFNEGNLFDLGSRGALLVNVIGELEGFLAAKKSTGTLQERAVWLVNMFDQADTGNAIMDKPGGQELRTHIEKLRKALNQQGKLTFLDESTIGTILRDRQTMKTSFDTSN